MTSYDDYFPSNYFKADDIVSNGPVIDKITKIQPEKMQDGKLKPCVFFEKDRRALVLNVTNKNTLKYMTKSNDPADAVGLPIMLVAEPATFQGKACMAIRIRPAPAAEPPRPAPSKPGPASPSKPAATKRGRPPGKKSAGDEMGDKVPF